jgi:hypothetical protein
MDVASHAYDLEPRRLSVVVLANAPSHGSGRRPKQLARQVLRDNRHGSLVIDIRPSEIASRHKRDSQCAEQSRRNDLDLAVWRGLAIVRREEAVIRARFEIYMSLPMRKVETMRPVAAVVDEIVEVSTFDSL